MVECEVFLKKVKYIKTGQVRIGVASVEFCIKSLHIDNSNVDVKFKKPFRLVTALYLLM